MNTRMCSQMQVVVLALSLLVLASRVRTAPRTDLLAHLLQNEADGKEDLSRILLLKLLSELEIPESQNDSLADDDMEVNRVLRHLPLTPRERKAGCRNFFWKTFTSC
ncbi:somatostatin-1 [Pangasianodon hypophthalmus]|uniref:somatostatin-1 n=1 Tax=Pangasianodon hypophthalmus TaxID=310915 RepID=UPI000EFF4B0C|nr:somatostatin-1 [Pangasianodon hypophthalmus]